MRINRADMLRTLEACQAGLNSKENMEQSSCVAFRDGQVFTYNGEILCQGDIRNAEGEPLNIHGAVPARELIDTLRKLPDDEIVVTATDTKLGIKGTGRKVSIVLTSDVLLETGEVENPEDWIDLPPVFSEALTLVAGCAGKDLEPYTLNCVSITPKGMQATDRHQAIRFAVATGLDKEGTIIRASSCKALNGLGVAAVSYTSNWIHWKSYAGIRVSVRQLGDGYPNLTPIFQQPKDLEVQLPSSVLDVITRAAPFVSEQTGSKSIDLHFYSNGTLLIRAENAKGSYEEEKIVEYSGDEFAIRVNPAVFPFALKYNLPIIVCESSLRIRGEGFTYCVSCERL